MSAYVRRLLRHVAAPVVVVGLVVTASACKGYNPLNPSEFGIQATDVVAGTGTQLRQGRGATVHYTLWLYDETKPEGKGTQLQTTVGGQTFSFAFGYGQVISGWDIGLDGMKVGGTRRLVIPPAYAYGAGGSGQIPGNATLVFDIQLVGVY
jgi:FKBP-type peptidyl-prolyl cis-trans isomerase FkpA